MHRRQILGGLVLLALTAAGIAGTARLSGGAEAVSPEEAAYLPANAPAAELAGEARSPNGRFELRAVGDGGSEAGSVQVPESLQIVDTATGEVKWEDQGYVTQSVLWSPWNNFAALAYSGRTWAAVKVISTAYWTSWDFTLPDGEAIPEYTFLPQEWGEWLDPNTLLVTVGRGGDAGEQRTYRCCISTGAQSQEISGSALEQTTETLPGDYDFDHDGAAETVELVTVLTPETPYFPAWYELNIRRADGSLLWSEMASLSHAGWNSLFACEVDGQDCLLWYSPWEGQGMCAYRYELFSLDSDGEELLFQENGVEFDMMFGSDVHLGFDAADIAAFLEEVHGYLDNSTLLLTTEGGSFRTGGSGGDFRDDMDFWDESCPYDDSVSLEENLRNYEMHLKGLRDAG